MSKLNLLSSVALAAALTALAGPAASGEVVLTSPDGAIEVTGDLQAVEREHYVIGTAIGNLRVSKAQVTCEGDGCGVETPFEPNFTILADGALAETLVPLAIEGFAASEAALLDIQTPATGARFGRFIAEDGYGAETVKFQSTPVTTAKAIAGLGSGTADVVFATRRITPDEARQLARRGSAEIVGSDKEVFVGQVALAAVVHPDNPVTEIGTQQLRDILSGAITNWRELGGHDAEIRIIQTAAGTVPGSMIQQVLMGDASSDLVEPATTGADDAAAVDLVRQSVDAIGFVNLTDRQDVRSLDIVSSCGIVSQPSEFHARAGDYSLVRPIVMYHRGAEDSDAATEFLAYADSADFKDLIEKAGFLGAAIATQDRAARPDRTTEVALTGDVNGAVLDEFASELAAYDRLSTTFKFRTGSSTLEEGGQDQMRQLAEFLATQAAGTRVTFAGFSDNVGDAGKNRALSLRRAAQLAEQMREMMPKGVAEQIAFDWKGYGEIRPRACNTSIEGRYLNRRVEVWISTPDAS